jgi:hypothetical protein
MSNFLQLGLATIFTLALSSAAPAWACVIVPLDLAGYPLADSADVPLDAVLIYEARNRFDPARLRTPPPATFAQLSPTQSVASVSLVSAEGAVTVSVRDATRDHFEVVPAAPLAPNTRYTLTVTWTFPNDFVGGADQPSTLRFTTGSGAAHVEQAPPRLSLTGYSADPVTSCDPVGRMVCISAPDDESYLVQFEGNEYVRLVRGSFTQQRDARLPVPADAGPGLATAADCMRVRRRAPNGQLSEPAFVCNSDAPHYDLDLLPVPDAGPPELEAASRFVKCDAQGLKLEERLVSTLFDDEGEPLPPASEPEAVDAGVDDAEEGEEDQGGSDQVAVVHASDCSARPGSARALRRGAEPTWVFFVALGFGLLARRRKTPGAKNT